MSLDRLVTSARGAAPEWDDARSTRVLSGAIALRRRRASRDRLLRRAAFAGSVAGIVCLVLFRAGGAPASSESGAPSEPLAASVVQGDAGFARD